jgi:hypothetical protein
MVELMSALTVLSLTMAGVVVFTTQALNTYFYDSGRLLINTDIRTFTVEMTTNAVFSNYFLVYQDFYTRSNSGVDANLNDGLAGDMLVLVYADTDPATGITTVNRLVGYYRDPLDANDITSRGPVRKFDVQVPNIQITTGSPMYTVLNTYVPTSTAHTNPEVIQLAQGSAVDPTTGAICRLFYNFYDRSIMIKGQISERGNLMRKYAINTYNFTVSPRG